MYGPHIYFVDFNGDHHMHYVGFDFVDLSYAGKVKRNKSPKRFINRFMRLCGFENASDYLGSLPGHTYTEKIFVSSAATDGDTTWVDVSYDNSSFQNNKFKFKFENSESYDNNIKDESFKFLKWFINVILFGNDTIIPMLLITPTMNKIKQYYTNSTEPSKSDVELWFCSDWTEDLETVVK